MEQKTPFKELTFSQKIQYIWDYYKIPIFLVIIGIIAVTAFIRGRLAQKNTVLSVLCVNVENSTTEDNDADIFNDFLTDNGYDLSEDEIALNKNIRVDVDKNGLDYQTWQPSQHTLLLTNTIYALWMIRPLIITPKMSALKI